MSFAIQPGSVLFKAAPRWVMAAELVETTRLWARTVARIQPEWAEQLAGHVVTRTYGDPRWSSRRGAAVAAETVRLHGLTLVADRTVDYGRVDAEVARELFIRHALVEGDWRPQHAFWRRNRALIAAAEALEDKLRRDVLVGADALFAFYDVRVGADVTSTREFDGWWKRVRREQPDLLDLTWELIVGDVDDPHAQFPDHVSVGTLRLPVHYRFDPGTDGDGATVDVPLTALNAIDADRLAWLVPGLRGELVTELLRALPKDTRRRLVPIPDTARAVLAALHPDEGSLPDAMTRAVRRVTGLTVERDAWRLDQLPAHLRMRVRVVDDGQVLAAGERLSDLRERVAPRLQQMLTSASGIERRGLRSWSFGELPPRFVSEQSGSRVVGYPALVDRGDSVDVRVLGSRREQQIAMWAGTRRLLLLTVGAPVARVTDRLDTPTKLALTTNPHGSVTALLDDALTAAVDDLMRRHDAPAWDAEAFAALREVVERELDDLLAEALRVVAEILSIAGEIDERLATWDTDGTRLAHTDMTTQLRGLVHPGFVTAKSVGRLTAVARYLRALRHRLDTLARDPDRDRERTDTIAAATRAYRAQLERLDPARRSAPDVLEIPWMIEELRVSLFAQAVGTEYRVSPERVLRAIDDLAD